MLDDSEALDWGVGDQDDYEDAAENYQQPQNNQGRYDPEDNDDTISLGEDDEDQLQSYRNARVEPVISHTNLSQELENRHISSEQPKAPRDVGANRDNSMRSAPEKSATDSYEPRDRYRQDRQESPPRRRARRNDRSPPRTPQPSANARVTHALPPKPVGAVLPPPHPSRVLVAEPTTISPRAGGRELKKQNDSGKPQPVSPASPPNRETRSRSSNGDNNHHTTLSKPADPTWQHPDPQPPRTNRTHTVEQVHEKDVVLRNRPAPDPTGLTFEDRHYRPGSDAPPANSLGRSGDRNRPDPTADRYSRSRHGRADSPPPRDRRPRSPPPVSDSRGKPQGYSDRHFQPSSYEPAPSQDYRSDSRRRAGMRLDDRADAVNSKVEIDRPPLRRRESSRGPRDRNPPRHSDTREPPVPSLPTPRPRSPPRTRDSNHRNEEGAGNREKRDWPDDRAPSNYANNRSGRRSPLEPPKTGLVTTLHSRYDDHYDRYPDYDPRLDPSPQNREVGRRERPDDADYSRYPRSQQPPPPERSGRHPEYDGPSSRNEQKVTQPPPRAPLPPQGISFLKRRDAAPKPSSSNQASLPSKPEMLPTDDARSRGSTYRGAPNGSEPNKPLELSSQPQLPPIDTRMDVDPRDAPASSHRSASRYISSEERERASNRRSRSPHGRYGTSMDGPPSARLGAEPTSAIRRLDDNRAPEYSRTTSNRRSPSPNGRLGPSSMNGPPSGRHDLPPSAPRYRDDNRGPSPPRRRDEREPAPRGNDRGPQTYQPPSKLPPSGPKVALTGPNNTPVNARRQPPPAAALSNHSATSVPKPAPAPSPSSGPARHPPPHMPQFMSALPPSSALMGPARVPKAPAGDVQERDNSPTEVLRGQERAQPDRLPPNVPTQPAEGRGSRRSRFGDLRQASPPGHSQGSVDSQDRHQRATPPPISREPSMRSKTSSERLSDRTDKLDITEERANIQPPEGSVSLIDRFSDRESRPVETDRQGRRQFSGPTDGPPAADPPSGPRWNLPPRPSDSPDVHTPQHRLSIGDRMDEGNPRGRHSPDRDVRMDLVHEPPPHLEEQNRKLPPSGPKVSLLARLSSVDNVQETQSLRERIVPSKRDRDEIDRQDGREASYEAEDGGDPKRPRRRSGKPRRHTGGRR